jgi:uncharacterized protein (DUF1015 family)
MATIKPFRGFRPKPEYAEKIASFPYDVLNSQEARELATNNPLSFLHVVKPEIDLPADTPIYDDRVYAKGRENLDHFIANYYVHETNPALYIYRQHMGEHVQTGLVAGAWVDDYLNNVIKKHEHTREAKEKDRIRHVDTLNANTGPVFLTYPNRREIDAIVDAFVASNDPVYDFVKEDGIRHVFWVLNDAGLIDQLVGYFADVPALYVADGHHRSASAAKVGQQRKAANPDHSDEANYNIFLSVLFPDNQLQILDYNRVVKDLNGLSEVDFLARVKESFTVEKSSSAFTPPSRETFGMYLNGQWYALKAIAGKWENTDPVQKLDVAILYELLLKPILGIGDPRKDERIDFVGGIRGLEELEKRVNSGEMEVAFSLYPTSIRQLMDIADSGEVMPPKSTWFEPKLRSGLIVHRLSE